MRGSFPSDRYSDNNTVSDATDVSDLSTKFDSPSIEAGTIQELSKFNTKMNELYVFFKGKIKPNLKTFDKSDIQNMMNDMNTLNDNFTDAKDLIDDEYENLFGITKSHKHKKVDTFIVTFEKNFSNSYSDIIATLKAYHTLGIIGSGLMMHDCMRSRMNNPHKYLM